MPTGSSSFPLTHDNFPVTRADSDLIGPDAVDHAAAINAIETELMAVSAVKTASYTVTDSDGVVRVDNSSASIAATLPTAVGRTGKRFTVVKVNSFTPVFACYLQTTSGQTISGASRVDLHDKGDTVELVSDGANWVRTGGNAPTFQQQNVWYAGCNSTASGNGRTPQTAFMTFAEAIAAATTGDTIYIGGINELVVIDRSVRVVGMAGHAIIQPPSGATSIDDKAVLIKADYVEFQNIEIRGHTTFKGALLALETASYARIQNIRITGGPSTTPTAYPTSPAAGTGIGGIGLLVHRGEGNYYEQLTIDKCSIGIAVGHECSTNSINRAVFSGCKQELVMGLATGSISQPIQPGPHAYGGGNGGGWTFINMKSTTSAFVSGTPVVELIGDGTTNYIGSDGGSNTFINPDFSEGGLPVVRIGTPGNTFIRATSAPECVWEVEGQRNHFINTRILGAGWRVESDNNRFDGGWSNGTIDGAGSFNHFRRFNFMNSVTLATTLTGTDNIFDDCYFATVDATPSPSLADLGTRPRVTVRPGVKALTYGTTVATDVNHGDYFTIAATNGTAFTISNPTDSSNSDTSKIMRTSEITYRITNSSGGALGVITWGSQFKLVEAFVNPPNTETRTITFMRDGSDWRETARSALAGSGSVPAGYFDRFGSGRWYGTPVVTVAGVASVAGRLTAVPFIVGASMSIDRIGVRCETAAASSTVALGIYSDNGNGEPASRLVDAGAVDTSTTGDKELTISTTLTPGVYWLAAVALGGTPTLMVNYQHQGPVLGTDNITNATKGQAAGYYLDSQTGVPASWSGQNVATAAHRVVVRKT